MEITRDKVSEMIDKGKPIILEDLELDPHLWAELRKTDPKVITPSLHNQLNVSSMDEMTRITKLLDDIKRGPVSRFERFCEVMKNTGRPQILEALGMDQGQKQLDLSQEPPRAVGMDKDFMSRMTVIADKVKAELLADRVRLQGRTGIKIETSLRAYIDQWEIIDLDKLDDIRAKATGAQAMEKLIDYLQECKSRSAVLFLRALVKLNIDHQLRTITKEEKKFVGQGEDKDMLKRLEDLDY